MDSKIFIVLDDRELVADRLQNFVGKRRYGEIIFQRQPLFDHFQAAMPNWASDAIRLRSNKDVSHLREKLEIAGKESTIFIVSARIAFRDYSLLNQLVEKLPYAKESFTDSLYKPHIVFMHNAHRLAELWRAFEAQPMHDWDQPWENYERLHSIRQVDLSDLNEFLDLISGSPEARHFNYLQNDRYYCTKMSTDRKKLLAEFSFYSLVPEAMKPWLVQPFDYQDNGETASYRMLRYYMADASLPWIHEAFDEGSFARFLDRLFFFLSERPKASVEKNRAASLARSLFVDKTESRVKMFLATEKGQEINRMAANFPKAKLNVQAQLDRYMHLYEKHRAKMQLDHLVIGHGDFCFSNILYERNSQLLLFLDPKGCVQEDDLWTNPLYDFCKVSHSILGDYDFINSGLFDIALGPENTLGLHFGNQANHAMLKQLFKSRLAETNYGLTSIRLGEASLFLSMLPLHLDHPRKVTAFLIKANEILDEVENG